MKSRWLILALVAAVCAVAWFRPRAGSGSEEISRGGGGEKGGQSALGATRETDATRRERSALRKADDSEARKMALKENLKKRFHSEVSEDQRLDECRQILCHLGRIADVPEVLAALDEVAGNSADRGLLLPAVFYGSRQSIPELVAAAKEMTAEDKTKGILGIAEKIQTEKLPVSGYATLHELVSGLGAQGFSVMLDLDLTCQDGPTSKQQRYAELSGVSGSMPAERRASFDVALAGVGRYEMPEFAWEALSGESSAGKDAEQLRAQTLSLMVEKDPATAMATLLRGRPTAEDDLVTSMTQWLSRDPVAAKEWYTAAAPMLIGERSERLSKLMAGP